MLFKKKKTETEYPKERKEEYFDFDRITTYFEWKSSESSSQKINKHTWADLDMDDIFMYLDRSYSKPGQQYLYYLLRSLPQSDRSAKIEAHIKLLKAANTNTNSLISALQKLNSRGSYFLHRLFTDQPFHKPSWFWVVYPLLFLTISSAASFTVYPQAILITLICIASNFIIHYINKSRLMEYSNGISQLNHLSKACKEVSFLYEKTEQNNELKKAQKDIKTLVRKSVLLHDNSTSQNEFNVISDSIIEIIKASLLIEPIMLYRLANEINRKKKELRILFEALAFADACLSIDVLRSTSSSFCIPEFSEERAIRTIDCFHPLIIDSQSNAIHIPTNASILISGSNMSGKTTFIRTIGVNAIIGQTINTVFAKEWKSPRTKIFSAISISDSLLNDESFYQKEVKVLKEIVKESQSAEMNLFLIDELYKGTNSIERIAAGAAVLSYIHNANSIVCASTHDLELTELLQDSYNNYHFTESVFDTTIAFDYKLKKGKLQNTNAIKILEANGYPVDITDQAKVIAKQLLK